MLRERTTNPHVLSSLAKLLANHAQDTNLWPQLETFLCFFQDHYSIPRHTKQPTICRKKDSLIMQVCSKFHANNVKSACTKDWQRFSTPSLNS